MSRLILPSRAEVIIREDVLENASDPRPNAFFDARTGMLRVYHGPVYGNPGGSLVPLQAQHVPIGTPTPPTSAWTNPWAGMMGGMGGRWPFSVNQRGGGSDQGMQNGGPPGNKNYSRYGIPSGFLRGTVSEGSNNNSGNNYNNRQRNNSRGKVEPVGDNDNKNNRSWSETGGSKPMPGSFNNDDDQNGNSGWNAADNNAKSNSNDDAWGTGNENANNDSPDNGGQGDTWGTDNPNNNNSSGNDNWGTNNNNASSGDDNWGTNNNNSNNNPSSGDDNWGTNNNNNNTSSGDDNWGTGPDNSNNNNNVSSSNSKWTGYKNRPNQNGTSQRIFPDATGTEFSAGSWGEPPKQESWGDKTAAQSTKNNSNDTSGW